MTYIYPGTFVRLLLRLSPHPSIEFRVFELKRLLRPRTGVLDKHLFRLRRPSSPLHDPSVPIVVERGRSGTP